MMRVLGAAVLALTVIAGAAATRADPFTVSDVAVDETAADAQAAREAAIVAGQRAAWRALVERLVAPDQTGPLLALDDTRIGNLVRSFEVADEKVAPDRYIASLTFHFNEPMARQTFSDMGASRTVTTSPPVLVLPVLETDGAPLLFELDNGWRDAWRDAVAWSGLVPVVVPIGDLQDIASIDAARALAGDPAALDAIARRYGTGTVAVAVARVPTGGVVPDALAVDLTVRQGGGAEVGGASYALPDGAEPSLGALFEAAARGTVARLEDAWRAENLVETGTETAMAIEVPVASVGDWTDVNRRLGGVGSIRRVDIAAMGAKAISLTVRYVGDEGRLASSMAAAGLVLAREADVWVLRRSGATADTVIVE